MKWTAQRWGDTPGSTGISILDEGGLAIANMVMDLTDNEMEIARLMAAAPALLEACEIALGYIEAHYRMVTKPGTREPAIIQQLKATLVKAQGRGELDG